MLYHKQFIKSESSDWAVFIHGAGGSSSIWHNQLRDYKKHFNVLLIDLRGHGRSKNLIQYYKENYSFELVAEDVVKVLEHLKIAKAHFIGVSLGTIIIRTIGEVAPERVQSAVLCGAITRLNFRSRFLVYLGNLFKRVIPYMWLYKLFAWIIMPRKRHSKSRNLFIREAKKLYQKEFIRWFSLTNDVNPLLKYFKEKELKIPVLYIMGSEDHMFLPPVRQMIAMHGYSTLNVIEKCGHVCNVERPQLFNKLSIQYLLRQSTKATY